MNNPIGIRLKVDYFDNNENFAQFLPRVGTISRQLSSIGGVTDWFLFDLDNSFDYQIRTNTSAEYKLLHCEQFLIRSRWQDHSITRKSETSVFILLIPDSELLCVEPIDPAKFYHVAWGMIHPFEY